MNVCSGGVGGYVNDRRRLPGACMTVVETERRHQCCVNIMVAFSLARSSSISDMLSLSPLCIFYQSAGLEQQARGELVRTMKTPRLPSRACRA